MQIIDYFIVFCTIYTYISLHYFLEILPQLLFFCFQNVGNGSYKEKDSNSNNSNSCLKDIRDKELEKENTDINIQNNQLNQTYDTLSTSNKESSRTKKKDNSSRPCSNTVIHNANIPKFYFPMGRPSEKDSSEDMLSRVSEEFSKFEGGKVHQQQMGLIAKVWCDAWISSCLIL